MRLLITLLFAVVLATPGLAEEPLTFKGFAIGSAKEVVLAAYPTPKSRCENEMCIWFPKYDCDPAHLYTSKSSVSETDCRKALSYGGVAAQAVLMQFREEKLVSARVVFDSEKFEDLVMAMTQRFGKADSDKASTVQNRMGASFDNRELGWVRGGVVLRIAKRSSKVNEGSVSLMSTQFMEERMIERGKAAKDRAKDL